jgi:hypothetical protein
VTKVVAALMQAVRSGATSKTKRVDGLWPEHISAGLTGLVPMGHSPKREKVRGQHVRTAWDCGSIHRPERFGAPDGFTAALTGTP